MAANSSNRYKAKIDSRQSKKVASPRARQPLRPQVQRRRVNRMRRSAALFIGTIRLLICGLGASAIAGTTISIVKPPQSQLATKLEPQSSQILPAIDNLNLKKVSIPLAKRLVAAIKKTDRLEASYLFTDLDSGEYSELGADRLLPAASTIKLPILIALFQDIDARKVRLDEKLIIDKSSIGGGAGDLQALPIGTQISVLVAATKMMEISDNTATNLLINKLGGIAALNNRFRAWGLSATTINRPLPDLQGTNITTVRELSRLMQAVTDRSQSPHPSTKIVSDASRSQIWNLMSNSHRNTMLPQGLGAGAKIAHKTGDIGFLVADVGTIELPSGKKYIATAIVKRPYNHTAGPELIRQMSKIGYEHFK